MGTKSPQAGLDAEVVNSEQLASRKPRSPAQSCVRQTLNEPWKMVPPAAGFGSATTGGVKDTPPGPGPDQPVVTPPILGSPLFEFTPPAEPRKGVVSVAEREALR